MLSLRIHFARIIVFTSVLFVVFIPKHISFAEVRYDNKIFTKSVTLKRIDQPFYFSGNSTIQKGVSVFVEKGVQIFIDGNILINGRLILQGEKDLPINIKPSPTSLMLVPHFESNIFTVIGGELSISHTNIRAMSGLIDAFSSSTVYMDNVYIEDAGAVGGSSAITVFNGSLLSIKDSTFRNIISGTGVEIFNQSTALIANSTFAGVGHQSSLLVYDGRTSNQEFPQIPSVLSIKESSFISQYDGVVVSSVERVKTQKAVEIFNQAYSQIEIATFMGFSDAGISAFTGARLEIGSSVFTENEIGIRSYNSDIQISESEIFGNTARGAILYGGTIDATNNWWGSESGPYSENINPSGRGDVYDGTANISPWKQLKPKRKTKCCSSVLFIPGMKGSRIYKKELLSENQLWEPNTTSDISKMYLSKEGYSVDKTLYVKDIIERTNILFGGNGDIEIYRSFVKSLGGLNVNYSIEDWQFSAYDWRMSPNTIVTEGARYGSNGQYGKMEDQVIQMSQTSKTKKVTLIAHSYGGLVTKRFLAYLAQKGKIDLIDKVIFVAVPENGSPSSLFALLHGDNQDIAQGFIVNKSTMRKFAQNMPSVYALLPKVDSDFMYGIQATNTISIGVPNIRSTQDMYKFLFKEISRPSTDDWLETNVPLIANRKVKENIDVESSLAFVKPQTDILYKNIEFYNILGVGLDTPKSVRYVRKDCQYVHMNPFLMSKNCGLHHEPINSPLGDGVVLADALLLNSFEDSKSYWGEKYIFNIGEYNRKNNKNYGHSNIISTAPVIETLMQIMLNNIGQYSLPLYMTKHGGSRIGGVNGASSGAHNDNDSNISLVNDIFKNKKYQISASDAVLLSAKDKLGNVVGINFPKINTSNTVSNGVVQKDILPVQNSFPNSSVAHVGESYYVYMESLPNTVSLRPDQNVLTDAISASNPNTSSQLVQSNIDFKIEEVLPPSSISPQNSISSSTVIASFENIPITEYSSVEVHIHDSVEPPNASSGLQVEMKVTEQYEGVYSSTITYTYVPSSINQPIPTVLVSDSSGQVVYGQTGGSLDIVYLIGLIRTEIQRSGVRANFKQRYLLKLNTIEKNYKSTNEAKKRSARAYAKDTTASLSAIIKDLNRARSFYYRGGMSKPEASFLYSQFVRLSRAFGD